MVQRAPALRPGVQLPPRSPLLLLLLLGCDPAHQHPPPDTDEGPDTDVPTDDTDTDTEVPEPEGDPATVELAGSCPLEARFGGFLVALFDGYSIVDGSVADGIVPVSVLEQVAASGDCRLMKRNNPHCDPPCGHGETCDFDGSCIPFPANQDLGTVTIGGLGKPVIMQPVGDGRNYFDTKLPHPVFEPGALVELRTGGGAFEPAVLHGVGVEPLVLVDTEWVLKDDEPLTFRWEPPSHEPARGHVHLRLNIDQHGVTPIQLFCELPDTGEATVAEELLAMLIQAGVTGFPNATVTRRTVDAAEVGEGCMDLTLASPVSPSVRVDGFTPCTKDADCPQGTTCNEALQICE